MSLLRLPRKQKPLVPSAGVHGPPSERGHSSSVKIERQLRVNAEMQEGQNDPTRERSWQKNTFIFIKIYANTPFPVSRCRLP